MDERPLNPDTAIAVRLDKWLWAARFFKTRTLAKEAIEAGHVRYEGERTKVSKDVAVGAILSVRQGYDELQVAVLGLSDRRGGAPEARRLYAEMDGSRERRERAAEERRAANNLVSDERPSKQQRRLIHRFKRSLGK